MAATDQVEPGAVRDEHPLDAVVWSALRGPHAQLAEGSGGALRYPADVSPFYGPDPALDDEVWADLAELITADGAGPESAAVIAVPLGTLERLPAGWKAAMALPGFQMIATDALLSGPDPEAVILGADDVPEMIDLIRRTEPGPFLPQTYRLGTYLGVRREGKLIAMAGERIHPPGFTEISAVCTDPDFRGQGLAGRLIRGVAHVIRERGETPFLHVAAINTTAISLYETLGFTVRRSVEFLDVRPPATRVSTG